MRTQIPHTQLADATYPDKDWRSLVVGFVIIIVSCITISFILWFWLQRSVDFSTTVTIQKAQNQFEGLSAVRDVMNTRSRYFKEIQKTPHSIVDPSLVR